MKKIIGLLLGAVMSACLCTTAVFAENFDMLYPSRGSVKADAPWNNSHNIDLRNVITSIDEEDGKTYVTGRTITNPYPDDNAVDGGTLRFWDPDGANGMQYWKNDFTYEYDFVVNTLDDYFLYRIGVGNSGQGGPGCILFKKHNSGSGYYINWCSGFYKGRDGNVIAGRENTDAEKGISHAYGEITESNLLQFGKVYHIKIAVSLQNDLVTAVFTDPETGAVRTEHMAYGIKAAGYQPEDYTTGSRNGTFAVIGKGSMEIVTSSEVSYFDRYLITYHDFAQADSTGRIKAEVSLVNTVYWNYTDVPELYIMLYDENGFIVSSAVCNYAEVLKPTAANTNPLNSTADYFAELDISGIEDGTYMVKTFLWRKGDDEVPLSETKAQTVTISEGTVVQ